MSRIAAICISGLFLSSCVFAMDSFEDWEISVRDYLSALPTDVKEQFADEAHVVAYALSVDCFSATEPRSDVDRSVAEACATSVGLLSDVMTASDLCDYALTDGSRNVARTNGAQLCGD